ncbi:MAG: hypothetical protein IPG42_13175 [Betaproteobacteria bacterium]|jgi:hypothetical protein|nr:hypothetical protein [Betaproteobacteria bacterium]MBK7654836.1 hypothetical protein [Betaproteobacteria bacterium]MBP6645586.1 hypothetical protein [Burkholderiaceae bacterium]
MQQFKHGITQTLGARLMAIQAQLLAERTRNSPASWDAEFEELMHGPEAQLLSSVWTRVQRREFRDYMRQVRSSIEVQALTA